MTKTPFLSWYKNKKSYTNQEISIDDYITFVKAGTNQDDVLKARSAKEQGNKKEYESIKSETTFVMGSCTIHNGKPKSSENIKGLNGLIVIDIDEEQVTDELKSELHKDEYTNIMHKSFGGGQNYCIFVKIDSNRFEDTFHNLADYYLAKYGIKIDPACKNINRFRFLSYDPEIFVNENSKKWKASKPKTKEIKKEFTEYIFFEDDFDDLLKQIKERGLNLCSDYPRWVNIGMSLASKFGISGADKFDLISSFDSKFDLKTNRKHYEGFCKSQEKITIGTFYYYCKEAGLDIYSEKTKTIINAVTVSKSQGNPTIASVSKNVITQGYSIEESDKEVIQQLIDSKTDYSKLANAELKEIEVLENFILQRYEPKYNEIDQNLYINDETLVNDSIMASIYITCKKHLDLKKDLTERNVQLIMASAEIPTWNPILEFFKEHYSEDCKKGVIKELADCIKPYNPYNEWALRKWLIGAVHNWTCTDYNAEVCPHTLVLTGSQHGVGKTSFMRNVLPLELRKYMKEDKIDLKEKDSLFRMGTSLMILDDEFGGKSVKDSKAFKAVSAKDYITLRRPFQKFDITVRRRSILGGTTNEVDIIDDIENRRIIPINFQGIDYEKMKSINKVDLLCEAYYELLRGGDASWIIIKDDKEYLRQNTTQNFVINSFEQIFLGHFSLTEQPGMLPIIINQGDIRAYFNDTVRPTISEVKSIVNKYKLEHKSRSVNGKAKQGYKVWVKTDNRLCSEWHSGFDETPF